MKLQALRSPTLLKRDTNAGFFPVKFAKILRMLFLETISSSDSFRFPACNFIEKETPTKGDSRCFSVNFAKFLRISFDRTPPDDCFLSLSVILRSFSEYLFYGAPMGSCLLHVQVKEINLQIQ